MVKQICATSLDLANKNKIKSIKNHIKHKLFVNWRQANRWDAQKSHEMVSARYNINSSQQTTYMSFSDETLQHSQIYKQHHTL